MEVTLFDIIRFIAIFQLLIFSFFLFIKKKRNLSSVLLGVHLTTQAFGILGGHAHLNRYLFFNYSHMLLTGFPFVFLWGPTFYFYVRAFVFSDFKLKWKHLLHLIPSIVILIYLLSSFYLYDAETKRKIIFNLFIVRQNMIFSSIINLQILTYCILSLVILKKYSARLKDNYSSIAKINLSWLKYIIIFFVSAFVVSQIMGLFIFYLESYRYNLLLVNFMIYFVFFNTIFFKGWNQHEIFSGIEDKVKYKSSNLTKDEAECWIKKLNNHIIKNKPYLNPGLTINQLAEELDIAPRILSQIINEYFNQNFYDYISKLRVEEAKRILSEPGNKKTVLEVIYETGYNSKSAFILAFKKYTGMTPTEFKKKN